MTAKRRAACHSTQGLRQKEITCEDALTMAEKLP